MWTTLLSLNRYALTFDRYSDISGLESGYGSGQRELVFTLIIRTGRRFA